MTFSTKDNASVLDNNIHTSCNDREPESKETLSRWMEFSTSMPKSGSEEADRKNDALDFAKRHGLDIERIN